MRLKSLNTSNCFLHLPQWLYGATSLEHQNQPPIVYFLTGNPGLISYYHYFLSLLSQDLGTSNGLSNCVIAGASLAGFDIPSSSSSFEEQELAESLCYPSERPRKTTYSLGEQNELCVQRIEHLVARLTQDFPHTFKTPVNVLLIGHSLGAYMALEIIRIHSERCHQEERNVKDPKILPDFASSFKVVATILLTPTIMQLSRSESGKLAMPMLSNIPGFPTLLQLGAASLSASMPTSWLKSLVTRVTGMRNQAALDATVAFVQTPGCVKQSLALAKDELREISEDKWGEEVWGVVNRYSSSTGAAANKPKHYFWFARQDHWVADKTREEIVKAHATRQNITIDGEGSEHGLVHAWCLMQSEMVAKQVKTWINEVLEVKDLTRPGTQ